MQFSQKGEEKINFSHGVLNKYNKIHNSSRSSYAYKQISVNICKLYSVICQRSISFKGIFPKGIVIGMDGYVLGFQK